MATVDSRQKVLMEGHLRHRPQSGIGISRWKRRHIIFRTSSAGRLEFVIYKESSPGSSPVAEVKSIPIEEFGGLETNLKLDAQEKYTFAIITTETTDCFATDSPEEYTAWTSTIREYLGKELVVSITIPSRQHMLRSGKAQMRIRNTGFTITTCDNPPRCQGTWQIIHIKQFGGDNMFKFLTGSKCPTGSFLYKIQAEDIGRIKSLFNDLSRHKPIFPDDRVGRRMMECIRHIHKTSNADTSGSGAESMRDSSQNPVYSNVPTLPIMGSTREPAVYDGSVRDSSVQEGSHTPENMSSSGDYQNVSASTKGRRSPYVQGIISTEHGSAAVANLSPPAALKKLRPNLLSGMHACTDSDEQSLEDSLTSRVTFSAPDDESDGSGNGFFHPPSGDRRQVYQNTSILSKQEDEELCSPQIGEVTGPVSSGDRAQSPHHPVAVDHSQRSYTNVQMAKLSVRGSKGRKTSIEILPGSIQMWNRDALSAPTSPQKHLRPANGEGAAKLADDDHHHHVLELSHSTEELESEQTDGSCGSPDLILPPSSGLLGHHKASSNPGGSSSGSTSPEEQFVAQEKPKVKKLASEVYSSADHLDRELDMVDTDQFNSDSEIEVRKKIPPRYDSLEILSPLVTNTQADLSRKSSLQQGGIYDSLAPLEDSGQCSSSPLSSNGLAAPRRHSGHVFPTRPQLDHLNTYHRKMMVTGRVHTYEIVSLADDTDDVQPQAHSTHPDYTQRTQRNPPHCSDGANTSSVSGLALNKQQHSSVQPHQTTGKSLKLAGSGTESSNGMGRQQPPPPRSESDRQLANGDGHNQLGKVSRGTHEEVVLPKGQSMPSVETSPPYLSEGYANITISNTHWGGMSESAPTRLPTEDYPLEEEEVMGTYIHATSNGSARPDFSLPLPSTNIVFNTPPIPPKPKILTQQPRDRNYVQLDLQKPKQNNISVITALNAAPTVPNSHHHGVSYTEIDLPSTEQLATMRKERQEEKGLAERQRTIKLRAV